MLLIYCHHQMHKGCDSLISFELSLLDFIQQHLRSGFGDMIMPFISKLGDYAAIWLITAAFLCLIPKYRKVGFTIVLAIGMTAVCSNLILKPWVARVRPCDVTAIQLLVPRPNDFSFPSGHTAAAFATASALFFSRKRLWIPIAIFSVLMAFSRLYLYVHYPSDVLAGAILGIILGWVAYKFADIGSTLWNQRHSKWNQR